MDGKTIAPPVSHLASVLLSGQFAVAAELSPPKGVNLETITRDDEQTVQVSYHLPNLH